MHVLTGMRPALRQDKARQDTERKRARPEEMVA